MRRGLGKSLEFFGRTSRQGQEREEKSAQGTAEKRLPRRERSREYSSCIAILSSLLSFRPFSQLPKSLPHCTTAWLTHQEKTTGTPCLESIGLATPAPARQPEPAPPPAAPAASDGDATPALTVTPPVATVAPVAAAESPKPAAKKPAKTSGHWGKLAGMLGLSVAQPPPEPEPEPERAPAATSQTGSRSEVAPAPERVAPKAVSDELPPDLFARPRREQEGSAQPSRERGDRSRRDERGPRCAKNAVHGAYRSPPREETQPTSRSIGAHLAKIGAHLAKIAAHLVKSAAHLAKKRSHSRRAQSRSARCANGKANHDEKNRNAGHAVQRLTSPGFADGLVEDFWPPESHPELAAEKTERDDFAPTSHRTDEPDREQERLGFDRPRVTKAMRAIHVPAVVADVEADHARTKDLTNRLASSVMNRPLNERRNRETSLPRTNSWCR